MCTGQSLPTSKTFICIISVNSMRLFLYETRKLLGDMKLLFFVLVIIAANVVIQLSNVGGEYTVSAYDALWDRLGGMTESERLDFVENRIDSTFSYAEREPEYADNYYVEQQLLKDVYAELEQVSGYSDYLKSIDRTAENMKVLSLFSDENSFDYRNIIRTQQDFADLRPANMKSDRSKGVNSSATFGITDILMLIMAMLLGAKLLSQERENEYFLLMNTTVNGRTELAMAKFAALAVSSVIFGALLYGSGIVTASLMYGFGDTSRAIQSVYGYFSCASELTVSGFLTLTFMLKLVFCAVLASLIFMFFSLPLGSAAGSALMIGFSGVQTALYLVIQPSSWLSLLRQVNVAALADSSAMVGKYLNINIFGQPVNAASVTVMFSFFVVAAGYICGVFAFCGTSLKIKKNRMKNGKNGRHTVLLRHELFKTFISGKALVILAAVAIITAVMWKPVRVQYSSPDDFFYYRYISAVSGKVTPEKENYIFEEYQSALVSTSDDANYRISALSRLTAHTEYLKETGGEYVADAGYRMLTGAPESQVYDRLCAAVKVFVLILAAAFLYCEEYRTGMNMLLCSSYRGRAVTFVKKLLSAVTVILMIMLIFDVPRITSVLGAWGTENITAPACSMEHLPSCKLSILAVIVLTEVMRFFGMVLISAAVFGISRCIMSYPITVTVSAGMFAVPLVLAAAGVKWCDYVLFNPLLIGSVNI